MVDFRQAAEWICKMFHRCVLQRSAHLTPSPARQPSPPMACAASPRTGSVTVITTVLMATTRRSVVSQLCLLPGVTAVGSDVCAVKGRLGGEQSSSCFFFFFFLLFFLACMQQQK